MYHRTVSIILPTLGRTKGLGRALLSIVKLYYPPNLLELWVKEDCGRIGVAKMVKQGVEETSGEYIVYASNDIEFVPNSLHEALKCSIDNQKGLVAFNTGEIYHDKGNICEHFIIKRDLLKYLDKGEIFDTDMHHVGVDNYLWAQCEKLGQAMRCKEAIVKHYHFTKGADMDETYRLGWSKVDDDRSILNHKLSKLYDEKNDEGKRDEESDGKCRSEENI